MEDKIILSPKILELNSSNDIYMVLKMVILTSNANLNGAKFTKGFIDGVIDNQSVYQGIPLVVNRIKLENEVFDSLSHEFDGTTLNTDVIGSFVSFEKQENEDGSVSLIGEARVYKRFPKTCEAINELYEEDKLRFSCEVLVQEYGSIEDGIREIPYASGKNNLIANCVVTSPAEVDAKPTLLVAALEEDLNEGGKIVEENFNKGKEISYNGVLENNELSFEDISSKIYDSLNPKDSDGYRNYNYWIRECFPSYAIVSSWNDDNLYQIGFTVSNDEVTIDAQENWIQVKQVYVPIGQTVVNEEEFNTLKEKVETLENEKQTLETKVEELSQVKSEEEVKDEAIVNLNSQINTLKDEIASLLPIKQKWDEEQEIKMQEELAQKQLTLKQFALNSKVIEEAEFESNEELKSAITELNEAFVKSLIADRVVAITSTNIETNTKIDDVIIATTEPKDLIPETLESKYGLNL